MQSRNINCQAFHEPDGTATIELIITNLTHDEADLIARTIRAPIKEAVIEVCSKGGSIPYRTESSD